MEFDNVLLALIKTHKEVTGYELNGIIKDSNRFFLNVTLAYIYPVLKKLSERGLVSYTTIPVSNRLDKKAYRITPQGEETLAAWLKAPIEADMYFREFLLKMEFAGLMEHETVLAHLDREIVRLEEKLVNLAQLENCINSGKLDPKDCEVLATLEQLLEKTDLLRIEHLKIWREKVTQK
jgi:DNA-binding PadR family transcriptional regulator